MAKRTRRAAALLILTGLVGGLSAMADEPLGELDALLKEYEAFRLPPPPRDAKLVRFRVGGGAIINGKVEPPEYSLAFLVKPGTDTEPPTVLRGVSQFQQLGPAGPREVEPEPAAADDVFLAPDDALGLAIQCHSRGWDRLARRLLDRSRKEKESTPDQLLRLAWGYWESRLTEPRGDRAPVARRLRELMRRSERLDTEGHRDLLQSLESALAPSKAKPGSIEALIDDLVDYNADTGTFGPYEPEERYWRIARLGFEAVPALIEHLDDDRLTRAKMQGFNNFRDWHLRVRHVVSDLLEGLAGEDLGRDWLRRQQGYPVEKAAAEKWWEKARKAGEEAYALEHVLPRKVKKGNTAVPGRDLLNLIRDKYPKHIPSLYRTVLDKRPELESWPLAEAALQSKLPQQEKLELFLPAVKHKDGRHWLPALRAVKELDAKQFAELLRATIDEFPKDVPSPYWTCTEGFVARLAIESEDPGMWTALEKAAHRASVGLRMELLNHLNDSGEKRNRRERLRLLAGFLDDDAVRDRGSSKQFEGPCAGFQYEKLEVRDFAAMQLASLVGIEVELNLERTPKQWAEIRQRVREAVDRELGKAPD
jgi:hypothetical protein